MSSAVPNLDLKMGRNSRDGNDRDTTSESGSFTGSTSTKNEQEVTIADNSDPEKLSRTTTAVSASAASSFPDGGRAAWTVVFGGWCCVFVSFGWTVCIGSFQTHYQTNQLSEYPPSTISWIPSTEVAMMFFAASICGTIFDRFGPKSLLLIGTFMHIFGLMMTSLATEYYQFLLAQSFCSGLGACAIFFAANNCVGTWFLKKRGLAFGLITSASSLSGSVLPVMIDRLIPRIGFAWTMRTIAFIFLALSLVALATVKSRIKPTPNPVTFKKFISPLLHERPYQFNMLAMFFFFWGFFIPFNFIVLQARRDANMSKHMSTLLITILNASSLPGRIILPALADKTGRFNMMICVTFICSVITLGLWVPAKSNAAIIAYTVLYGIFSGAFVSLTPSIQVQLSPNVREIGARGGLSMMFISIAVLTGNPIAGALVTKADGAYTYLQVFAGLSMTLGCCFFAACRYSLEGLKRARV
ncbi:MFS general substrate transporter [Ascobolus immersus RN42]|uniref:MFS general substrate transporter n=1 Tax=Ascobolus immersus RN42 TaxID=1160509 RepID=A0A3N4HR44_ASCIM|nr:MFS general substrate transporter [Ascobolus immersus RN42]